MTDDIVHSQDEFDPHELNVLILEDNDICRKVAELNIGSFGFNFKSVATLKDFYDAYAKRRYDILLLDIHLRGSDGVTGIDIARQIRAEDKANRRYTILIAYTAGVEEKECMNAGFDAFVQKGGAKSLSEVLTECLHNYGLGKNRGKRGGARKL